MLILRKLKREWGPYRRHREMQWQWRSECRQIVGQERGPQILIGLRTRFTFLHLLDPTLRDAGGLLRGEGRGCDMLVVVLSRLRSVLGSVGFDE